MEQTLASLSILRFKVGDRVECSTIDGWITGTVIELRYTYQDDDGRSHICPYLIRLDDGNQICNPYDNEHTLKRSNDPPLVAKFQPGVRVEWRMFGSNDWFPGTVKSFSDNEERMDVPAYTIKFDEQELNEYGGPQI